MLLENPVYRGLPVYGMIMHEASWTIVSQITTLHCNADYHTPLAFYKAKGPFLIGLMSLLISKWQALAMSNFIKFINK